GISALKLFVNGVPIRSNYVPDRSTTGIVTQKFDARLLRGKNEIRAVAYNRRRVASYPASRRVFFEGPQPTGKLWILAAGLEDYENPSLNLNWCVNDILESTSSLTERGSDLFEDQDTRALLNQEATRSAIEKEFSQLAEKIHPEDTFVFLYAGHGMVDAAGDFYLVTYDVSAIDGNASPADDRALPGSVLLDLLNGIKARKRVLLFDACHSGALASDFRESGNAAPEVAIAHLSRGSGTAILASSQGDQLSRASQKLRHGYFTWTFLEGLREGAAEGGSRDGRITILELAAYISSRLPVLTAGSDPQKPKPPQYSKTYISPWIEDFPLGRSP
ncbi:MAG: caspase family protein, partial [Verrucomicrobiota bacterium]